MTLIRQLWMTEARRRRDEVRKGQVRTIPGEEALAQVRRAAAKMNATTDGTDSTDQEGLPGRVAKRKGNGKKMGAKT